jgi:glycerol-3-phosphate dehydrogenase
MRKLERNPAALSSQVYDLVIVGGGIFGVCAAWEAALRGLSVALVEKGDFVRAASSNHFKMVHGGIRYLQHGDIARIRESSRERSALLRIAPHLVKPLPIVIPGGNSCPGRRC